ncbi:hypothetical protein [Halarchaeum sp. P4]
MEGTVNVAYICGTCDAYIVEYERDLAVHPGSCPICRIGDSPSDLDL